VPPSREVDILDDFLGRLAVVEKAHDRPVDDVSVPVVDGGEGRLVAGDDPGDELRVAGCGRDRRHRAGDELGPGDADRMPGR
jgi:hypothetical protein